MRVTASSRANALLAIYSNDIWKHFDEEEANPEEVFVLVQELQDGIDIRLRDRDVLAGALRVTNGVAAAHIQRAALPPGTIMVMVVPLGDIGGLVVPLSRKGKKMEGSA